jgi:hypothetical protein
VVSRFNAQRLRCSVFGLALPDCLLWKWDFDPTFIKNSFKIAVIRTPNRPLLARYCLDAGPQDDGAVAKAVDAKSFQFSRNELRDLWVLHHLIERIVHSQLGIVYIFAVRDTHITNRI